LGSRRGSYLVEVSEGALEDAALETIGGNLWKRWRGTLGQQSMFALGASPVDGRRRRLAGKTAADAAEKKRNSVAARLR
jgi:hypothetical protein